MLRLQQRSSVAKWMQMWNSSWRYFNDKTLSSELMVLFLLKKTCCVRGYFLEYDFDMKTWSDSRINEYQIWHARENPLITFIACLVEIFGYMPCSIIGLYWIKCRDKFFQWMQVLKLIHICNCWWAGHKGLLGHSYCYLWARSGFPGNRCCHHVRSLSPDVNLCIYILLYLDLQMNFPTLFQTGSQSWV